MPHVTSIGLDVHARSVAAAAFNPFTGEVVRRSFGTDASEIAEWALVSVNIIFTISTNAFSPIAPTRIHRIRQRGCAAFGA